MARKKRAPLNDRDKRIRREAARIRSLYKMGAPIVKNKDTYAALDYLDRQRHKMIHPHIVSSRIKVQRRIYGTRIKYPTGAILFPIDVSDVPVVGQNTMTPSVRASISKARRYALLQIRKGKRTSVMFRYLAEYDFAGGHGALKPTDDYTQVKTQGWAIQADAEALQDFFQTEIVQLAHEGFIIVDITVQGQDK